MSNVIPIAMGAYTVDEVAEQLGVSTRDANAMVRKGQVPTGKRAFHAWLDELPEATDEDVARELGL